MIRLTLRLRLLLLTLLPSALIGIALVSYFTVSGINNLEAEQRSKGLATARYLAPVSEFGIISGQVDSLHALAQTTVQEPGVKAVIIVNQKGRVIAVSGRVSLGAEILRATLADALLVHETESWVAFGAPVIRSLSEGDALFEPLAAFNQGAKPETIGQVFIELDKTDLANRQRELLHRGLLIVLIGMLMLAAFAIAMADNLAKPVLRLVRAVGEMSAGRFETRVAASTSGEIGVLEHGFNDMANHIEDIHHSMQSRIEEATAQLAYQARHDALTGIFNRREFEVRLEKALTTVQAGGDEFSVLFIDLDRFKPVNDACGHLAGDELLRQIANLFGGRLREDDTLARLGGDEFGIILANCAITRAKQVADDICNLTNAFRFIWQDKVFAIGASIGLTPVDRQVRSVAEIITAADSACFSAKDSGRNCVLIKEASSTPDRRQEGNNWAARLSTAIQENRLSLEALPIVSLQGDAAQTQFSELSARLIEPGHLPIALPAIRDAAERYELGPIIDLHLVETAIATLERARRRHRPMRLLVPLSGAALGRREVVERIAKALARNNLSGHGLCFLFSESVSTLQNSLAVEFSKQVRALGCEIGLDDFGGGPASFNQLRSLSPSIVRLGRSLTRIVDGNRASTALLRAIQEITADLSIETLVDAIDSPAAMIQMRALGINYAQGKALAPGEPFEAWLEGAVLR